MEEVDGKKMKMTRADGGGNHISPPIRHHHSTIESSYIGKEQQKNRPTELEILHTETFDRGLRTKARSLKQHFRGTACSFRGSYSILLYSLNSELKRLNRRLHIVKQIK